MLRTPGCASTPGRGDGSVVGVHYDPMLAKVIAWAPTRDEAARRWPTALPGRRSTACVTNRDLLVNVLRHPAFLAGDTDTAFFDRHGLDVLAAPLASADAERLSALAAALADAAANRDAAPVGIALPERLAQRGVGSRSSKALRERAGAVTSRSGTGSPVDGLVAEVDLDDVTAVESAPDADVVLDVGGVRRRFEVTRYGDDVSVDFAARSGRV